MIYLLIAAVFILSVALTSGSILILSHLRTTYKTDFFSTLLFFLVFYFTFGFYAIWGQMITTSFLTSYVTPALLPRITDVMVVLGSPFLIFASLMFVRFAREITGRKISNPFILWYLIITILLVAAIIYASYKKQGLNIHSLIKYYFVVLNLFYVVFGAFSLLLPGKNRLKLRHVDMTKFSVVIVLFMVIQNILFLLYDIHIFLALSFILCFFISGGFIPLYFRYKADLSRLLVRDEDTASLDQFCLKYSISPRETEIIREICRGLSNQQIADKLFISLQTVKDHTHRIYSKTECNSRSMLMLMVSENG
jgi:DNA-binding CsgD family transcriptional regulator